MQPDFIRRSAIYVITAAVLLAAGVCAGCKPATLPATLPAPLTAALARDPMKDALHKVEEDRGEAMGRDAVVENPPQLRHYADRRRFLAIQAADARANVDETSFDFADLARSIQRGELIEMPHLGAEYILYGVGYNADEQAFAHFDRATQQDIPLGETETELREELQRVLETVKQNEAELSELNAELRRTPRRQRARRASLLKQIAAARKTSAGEKSRSRLLKRFYDAPVRRQSLLAGYQQIATVAGYFKDEGYDLRDGEARRRLKMRLLSFIRPEARDLLVEIAKEYKEKFDRPLPVSSLVRPVQYQRRLARSNRNAARVPLPPHSTGFSFDLFYRYMSAAEQEFLMSKIADLEDQGRVEALRESRNNIHVYVFSTGRPPDEKLIAEVITAGKASRPVKSSAKNRNRKPIKKARQASRRR